MHNTGISVINDELYMYIRASSKGWIQSFDFTVKVESDLTGFLEAVIAIRIENFTSVTKMSVYIVLLCHYIENVGLSSRLAMKNVNF